VRSTSIEVLAMAASLHAAAPDSARLDAVLRGVVNGKDVPGAVARIERGDGTVLWQGAAGTMVADDAWFVASITKLFTAAIVLQLHADGRLGLDDRIGAHLPAETLQGLHGSGAADRSAEITARQLLSHTSGLPDHFEGKAPGGTSLATRLLRGDDDGWTPADALAIARSIRPRFEPGAKDKASYADTNYRLLGLLVERVEGRSFDEVLAARIIEPLGLRRFHVPRWMSPFRASPVLLGHGGTSGAFAFYDPARDLMFVGTVNSATSAGRPYRLLLRLHAAATR
jgi:CubicO group peptidase (beta-lactamase class C family)